MFHELPLRDHEDGRATGQPQGPTPEDARQDGQIQGRSRQLVKYPG
jgi:hypothetical protein